MNFIKKLALFILASVSLSGSLFGMNSDTEILPVVDVYYHESMLADLLLGTKETDGILHSNNQEHINKDKNGYFSLQMQMNIKDKQIDVGSLVRRIAKQSYCDGFNYASNLYRSSISIMPFFVGAGFGAGCIGLAWYLKSKSYF